MRNVAVRDDTTDVPTKSDITAAQTAAQAYADAAVAAATDPLQEVLRLQVFS